MLKQMSALTGIFILIIFFSGCFEYMPDVLEVKEWSPGNHETGLEPDAVFEMRFSAALNRRDIENHFYMYNSEGSVSGRFHWINDRSFRFVPDEPLFKNGRYVVEVPSTVRDKEGSVMSSDFISDFYIGEDFEVPEVIYSTPPFASGGASEISVKGNLVVAFSKTMNRESVEKAFRLRPDVPGYFEWSCSSPGVENSRLTYVTVKPMDYGRLYRLTVSENAEDYAGNRLSVEYRVNFITGNETGPPEVKGIYDSRETDPEPWCNESINRGIDKKIKIEIEFSDPMNRLSVENSFSITPSVPGNFDWKSDSRVVFKPFSDLEPERRYQLRIDTGSQNHNGLKTAEPYIVEFITDHENSLHVNCSLILGSNDGINFEELSRGVPDPSIWPLAVNMGDEKNQSYYVKIHFGSGDSPADMDIYTLYENYLLTTFKSGAGSVSNAVVSDIYWEDESAAVIKISGMTNTAMEHEPYLYRLTVAGGGRGVRDKNNNTMRRDLVIDLREASE